MMSSAAAPWRSRPMPCMPVLALKCCL